MSSNSGKVLIAHGNTKKLRGAVDLMREAGFEVIATPDGGDAFARFFEEEPGIVLCSAQLPGLSGVSFAAMIESQAPGTHVAILVDPDEPQAMEGAEHVPTVIEPLTMEALRAALPNLPERPPPSPADDSAGQQTTSGVFALAALKRFQRDNSLLAVVDERGLNRIAAMARHQLRMSDEQVINEGDAGDGFYLVVEGQARVTLAEKNNQEIARIGAGGFFGEMAMLSDRKRSASVWTVGPTTLLFFSRDEFMPLLQEYSTLREVLSGVALKRTEENLWRTLFDDDDVQRSIGSLSEAVPVAPFPEQAMPPPPPEDPLHHLGEADHDRDAQVIADLRARVRELEGQAKSLEVAGRVREVEAGAGSVAARKRGLRLGAGGGGMVGVVIGVVVAMVMGGSGEEQGPIADGRESIADGRGPVADGRKPIADDRGPIADGRLPIADDRLPIADGREPIADGRKPIADGREPAVEVLAPPDPEPSLTGVPSPKPPVAVRVLSDADRKRLRRELINAEHGGDHAKALAAGVTLEKANALDWEAAFNLARAEQQGGASTQALARFSDFVTTYPKNDFVDDAYFYSGEILQARGRKQEAIDAFTSAATRPKSNFVDQARAHLEKLGAPLP